MRNAGVDILFKFLEFDILDTTFTYLSTDNAKRIRSMIFTFARYCERE